MRTCSSSKCCGERNWADETSHVLHSEIRLTPERASTVITVCAILHNLCKRRNIPQPDDDDDDDDDDEEDDDHDDDGDRDNEFGRVEPSGLAFRDHFENPF